MFSVGEYGDSFQRPHYHCLFFGLDYLDCRKIFRDSWKKGIVYINPLLNGGIRYVLDYMTKNLTSEMAVNEYDETNRERPFYSASKGLGFDFFYAHRKEIENDGFIKIGSKVIPIPVYYKNIFSSFSDENITVRENVFRENYNKIMREAHQLGFNDYDKYINYTCRAKELSLAAKLRSKGYACTPSYYSSLGDGHY